MAITITINAANAKELKADLMGLVAALALTTGGAVNQGAPKPVQAPAVAEPEPDATEEPTPAPTAEPAQAAAPSEPAQPDHGITRETLIPHLAALTQAGKRDQVQAIFAKYGAEKLSDVDPKHYPAILADAQALAGAEGGPPF